ncbi:hypothetical protein SAMN05421866_4167 [Chryseobacterium oranimense]|uniref:DUF5977 domain-containing protein n=1 Tax=Chryseobacterium oranimense TaxID=421058 RepID=A0A1M5WQL6_9FLAO|nr:DUF5977 domain-containing protein [Chryseobacterium oranimense]SHH89434.1 hypothetical protein SAMN05421866_4167 [Chryseobacterium oranimense]
MKIFSIQLTFILMIVCQLINAQDRPMEDYSIAKRINISNDYNSGKPSITIPLYNINLDNLNLSASLGYLNNLIIGEPAIVGTNWDVNLFGKIILQYSWGDFDPIPNKQANGFYTNVGRVCFIREQINLTKKQMLDNPNANVRAYTPNKFYFEFLGYKGTFVSDNVGNIIVSSDNSDFKVTFNGDRCYNDYSPISNSLPEIIMEDQKGNKFYFGGDYNSLDINYAKNKYTYSNMVSNGGNTQVTEYDVYRRINYINGFYLKKIELNSGRIIEAFYKNGNKDLLAGFTNGGYYFGSDYSFVMPSKSTLENNNLFIGVDKINNYNTGSDWNTSTSSGLTRNQTDTYQKIAILDSIKLSDYGIINFEYQQINNDLTKPFLKKIQLKNNNKLIKTIDFNYNIKNDRVFLGDITANSEKYAFNYYDELSNQSITNSYSGLISKIIYPTKGFDVFEYEQNNVSKVIGVNSNYIPVLNEIQDTSVPGQRLKAIKSYSNNSNYIEKKYTYKNDNGKSSGITTVKLAPPTGSASDPLATFSTNGGYYKSLYGPYITYSKVTEEIMNKGKSEFYFTDMATNPDSLDVNRYATYSTADYGSNAIYINKNVERGKLFLTKKYDNDNNLVFQETIKYKNFLHNANLKKEVSNTCLDCKITDYRFYVNATMRMDPLNGQRVAGLYTSQPLMPFLPASINTKQLTSDKSTFLETTTNIEYNDKYLYWHLHPIKITTNVNGKITTTYNYYPGDVLKTVGCYTANCSFVNLDKPGRKMLTYKQMTDSNINFPILILNKNSNNKFSISEKIFEKFGVSNKYRLLSERINDISSSFDETNFENAVVFETKKYEIYDSKENLIQSTPQTGIPITTIWGYHQTLPIAKIEGATYSQIMQIFNLDPNDPNSYLQLEIVKKSDLDKDDLSENVLISKLDNFKNHQALKDYLITTYTYDPLIGIKSINPPSGIKENYLYDTYNRLEKIVNIEGNILKEYKYNYAPTKYYNSERSGNFMKYCGSSEIGTTFTYTVAPNTYTSIISQDDADQKAQNDVNANGQNAANNNPNGTCTPFTCNLSFNSSIGINGGGSASVQPNSYYKLSFGFSSGSNSVNLPWSTGVTIGTISGTCRPTSEYSSYNGQVYYTIKTNGEVILKTHGSTLPNNTSYNYDIIFPIN